MRKKIIAGNWKMNKTPSEAVGFVGQIKAEVNFGEAGPEIVLCVPALAVVSVAQAAAGTNIKVGAQHMHYEDSGAYTGEISAKMIKDAGASYVIIGHSERRKLFHESDADVNKKVLKALSEGLIPIVCVGEDLEQRRADETLNVIRLQTGIALKDVPAEDVKRLIIAYEPVWAIGTGVAATNEQAQEGCAAVRNLVCDLYGDEVSQAVRVQYGGSVNAGNAEALFALPDIDGGLVGNASLTADFVKIARAGGY